MKKTKIFAAGIITICLICLLATGLTGCKKTEIPIDDNNLIVYMEDDFYLGTLTANGETTTSEVDLAEIFSGASNFTFEGNALSISGTVATVLSEGEGTLVYKDNEGKNATKNVYVTEGVNVFSENEMRYFLNEQKMNVILQKDIKTTGETAFITYGKVYGNGHEIDAASICRKDNVFFAGGISLYIQDLHLYGEKVEDTENLTLEYFIGCKDLISIVGDGYEYEDGNYPESVIKNCVIENGHKLIRIYGADITIEGCIIRNGSNALIGTGTGPMKGSVITMKNNVLSNGIVAGILFFGYQAAAENSQQTLNIEGFLDIYNWKKTDNIQLMSSDEQYADLVNVLVRSSIKDKEYAQFLYTDENGDKYLHVGMIKLATSELYEQNPTINGMENVGLSEKNFPLPSAASRFAHVCKLISYENVKNPAITPSSKLGDNENLYKELRYGRQ